MRKKKGDFSDGVTKNFDILKGKRKPVSYSLPDVIYRKVTLTMVEKKRQDLYICVSICTCVCL